MLEYLVTHRDRVVPKEELLDHIWGDRFVSEATLASNIRAARAGVGDDGRAQRVIKTIHGRGYRFVAPPEEVTSQPLATSPPSLGNVPLPTGRLVGREQLVEQVCQLLDEHRLVSLVGSGGVGKTRVATEVARQLAASSPDGAWLAMLETVVDTAAAGRFLLSVLGIDEQPGRDELESLVVGLRGRRCLLVLDNCEHVLDAAAELATGILRSCPDVRVLATSREPLDVEGEHVRRVEPLEVGDGQGPAVDLFFERARDAGCPLEELVDGPRRHPDLPSHRWPSARHRARGSSSSVPDTRRDCRSTA